MPTTSRHSKAVRLLSALLMLAGCVPAPTHTTSGGNVAKPTAAPGGGGAVVVGATNGTTPVTTSGGLVPDQLPKPALPPPIVTTPVVSNNGASVIHGSVLVPPAILSNNGAGIVSPNGGTIVSPNGGTVVSPNGGTIVSPNGGTIVSPNGGTIVSNNGGGFKLAQVPLRFAEVKLSDASGAAVKDASGADVVTKTDENGAFAFPVDVRGRNLLVRAQVPGQSEALLGLVSKTGSDTATSVDLNSTLSLSYIIQNYVGGDLSRFELLQEADIVLASRQTDAAFSDGKVDLPTTLAASDIKKKVDEIRLRVLSADEIFQDIRRRLVPVGNLNEGDGLKGLEANFGYLGGGTLASDGSVYFLSNIRHTIWRLDNSGIVRTLVARGSWGYKEAPQPTLEVVVSGIAVLPGGSLVVADTYNNRIVRVNSDGEVVTLAGNGEPGYSGDNGNATDAKINRPTGLCLLGDGGILFSDSGNSRIRRIDSAGVIKTIIGDGKDTEDLDSRVPGGIHLKDVQGLKSTPDGRLLIADTGHHRIIEESTSNTVTRVLNDTSKVQKPVEVALIGNDIYVLDSELDYPLLVRNGLSATTDWNNAIESVGNLSFTVDRTPILSAYGERAIISDGQVIFRGDPLHGFERIFGANIQDLNNSIDREFGLAISSDGTVYISDAGANRVFAKTPLGVLRAIAGDPAFRGDIPNLKPVDYAHPLEAPLPLLGGLAMDTRTDELLVAVQGGEPSIRRLTKDGNLKVEIKDIHLDVRGANGISVRYPVKVREIAVGDNGEIYIGGHISGQDSVLLQTVIGRVKPDGTVEQVAGTANMPSNTSFCVDSRGRPHFLDAAGQTVYRIDGSTLVSLWEVDKYFKQEFWNQNLRSVTVDLSGNFYITEGFHVYRLEWEGKRKTLVAGEGGLYLSGGGRDTSIDVVTRMVMSRAGDLYLLDRGQVKLISAYQLSRIR